MKNKWVWRKKREKWKKDWVCGGGVWSGVRRKEEREGVCEGLGV